MGREWELNLRHHGNGIGNGNEVMGMGGNGNVASHSRTSLIAVDAGVNVHTDTRKLRSVLSIVFCSHKEKKTTSLSSVLNSRERRRTGAVSVLVRVRWSSSCWEIKLRRERAPWSSIRPVKFVDCDEAVQWSADPYQCTAPPTLSSSGGSRNLEWGRRTVPPLSQPSSSFSLFIPSLFPSFPSLPLEVCPLNLVRVSGEGCKLP